MTHAAWASILAVAAGATIAAAEPNGTRWIEEDSGGTNGVTDAGPLLGNANVTASGQPGDQTLTQITGILTFRDDVDMFRIRISNPAGFSASTFGPPGSSSSGDTILALFTETGVAVGWNDNRTESPTSTLSTLTNATLTNGGFGAGIYYLAVARNDLGFGGTFQAAALDGNGNEIFPFTAPPPANGDANTDRRAEYGPTTPGTVLASWREQGGGFQPFNANYNVNLTGVEFSEVPAPGATAALVLGLAAFGRRRR